MRARRLFVHLGFDVDPVEEIVQRALVDGHARGVLVERLGNPERRMIEPLCRVRRYAEWWNPQRRFSRGEPIGSVPHDLDPLRIIAPL